MARDDDRPIPLSSKDLVNLLAERLLAGRGAPERKPATLADGDLDQLDAGTLLEQASAARVTGFYELFGTASPDGKGRSVAATVSLRDGTLVAAELVREPAVGALDALAELLCFGGGSYSFWKVDREHGQRLPAGTTEELLEQARRRAAELSRRSRWERRAGLRRRSHVGHEVVEVWLLARVEVLEFLHDVAPLRPPLPVGGDPRFLLRLHITRVAPEGLGLEPGPVDMGIHSAAVCGLELNASEGQTYELSLERWEDHDGVHWDDLVVERGPIGPHPSSPSRESASRTAGNSARS